MWRAIGGQITYTKTYLNFVTRDPITTVKGANGQDRNIYGAVRYSNSEVGAGKTLFTAGFVDGYCTNGCWFGGMTIASCEFVHRGAKISTDFGEIFDDRIQQIELAEIHRLVTDATKIAVSGAFIPEMKALIEGAVDRKITVTDRAKFIRLIGQKVGLTGKEAEDSLLHFDGQNDAFGIQQAITRLAQDASTYDDRMRLEEAGGAVLAMKPQVWKSVEELSK